MNQVRMMFQAVILATFVLNTGAAQEMATPMPLPAMTNARPLQATPTGFHHYKRDMPAPHGSQYAGMGGSYPQLNAPLYPSPVPHVPQHIGGTYITNPALSPHEMLYPHQYKAMYGPYYYKVHGKWFLTPFGVRSHENWKLMGTEVSVKYRSHYKPFSLFTAPFSKH